MFQGCVISIWLWIGLSYLAGGHVAAGIVALLIAACAAALFGMETRGSVQ